MMVFQSRLESLSRYPSCPNLMQFGQFMLYLNYLFWMSSEWEYPFALLIAHWQGWGFV
jgi:hypothetical protein